MSPCAAIIIFPQNVTVVAACATVVVVAIHIVYLWIVVSRLKNEIKTLQGLKTWLKPPVIIVFFWRGWLWLPHVVVAVHIIYLKIVSRLYKNKNKILQGLEMQSLFFLRGMTITAVCATVVMVAIHAIYLQIDVSRLYNNNNNLLQATCCCLFFEGDGCSCHSGGGGHSTHYQLKDSC